MRRVKCRGVFVLLAALLLSQPMLLAGDKGTPPPAREATSYPAVDVHDKEGVAVAADPLDTREKESFFQVDYLKAGYLPVRLIVTNNSADPVKLDEVRVYFLTANGDRVRAADTDDVERSIRDVKDPGRQMEKPFPLKGMGKPKDKDPKVESDFKVADFATLTVAPHSTQSGYLFFNVSGLQDELVGAKLLVRGIETQDGTPLFYFEAPFDKYLAAKKKP
jgi:hypothetical protein